MKKILLIEDRVKRQQLFIDNTGIDLSRYSDILDNETDKNYYELILIKMFSSQRLLNKIGVMPSDSFKELKQEVKDFID